MAHPDLNSLKAALLPIAEKMLTDYGEFFPFGTFMTLEGKIVHCSTAGEEEHPPSQEVIDMLTAGIQERVAEGMIRAVGICSDVRVATKTQPEKIDAIQFALEHQNGEAVNAYVPYNLDSSSKARFGAIFATKRDRVFFPTRL